MESTEYPMCSTSGSPDSLAIALHALIGRNNSSLSLEAVGVALGLSLSAHLVIEGNRPLRWIAEGRDFNLAATASLFGLSLRDLHPRPAAKGLTGAPEFRTHFLDSYKPLIQRAMENSQPVLAWCGWPDNHAMSWGILTHETDHGLGLAGVVPGCGEPVSLVAPALQCYVIESAALNNPADLDILRCGINALAVSSADAQEPNAYDQWLCHIESVPQPAALAWKTMAKILVSNYRLGTRFLSGLSATTSHAASLDRLRDGLQNVAEALEPITADGSVDAEQLRLVLERARDAERQNHATIVALAADLT